MTIKIVQISEINNVCNEVIRDRVLRAQAGRTQEYIAFLNETEVGFGSFGFWTEKSLGYVYELFVLPCYRRKGIGDALLRYAEDFILTRECAVIQLEVNAFDRTISQEWLMSWYLRRGYLAIEGEVSKVQKSIQHKLDKRHFNF